MCNRGRPQHWQCFGQKLSMCNRGRLAIRLEIEAPEQTDLLAIRDGPNQS